MLVITRKAGEKIYVGDDVVITVARVGAAQVRIGVDAPKDVAVYREEVYLRIQGERKGQPHAPRGGHDDREAHGDAG